MNAIKGKLLYLVAFFFMFTLLTSGVLYLFFNRDMFASADSVAAPAPQSVAIQPTPVKVPITGVPSRLMMPDVGIDLPVTRGAYNTANQSWTLDSRHVFINTLTNSDALIGEREDTSRSPLLYGHNSPKLLGKTKNLVPGQVLQIVTENGYVMQYSFARAIELTPQDSWILDYTGTEDLMLMTCSGVWYEKRRVLFFDLVEVRRI
jgi:hypothetical protein